ncbi:MAG: LptF/LptG family permease [Nitrospira sp.]|nr:MAG: LptF/LptG family permease [Nitrospira sp.]
MYHRLQDLSSESSRRRVSPEFTGEQDFPIVIEFLPSRHSVILRTLLDRYIFTELLSPFGLSLGALCFVMLTRELLRLVELLVSKGVGFWAVLKVIAMLLPSHDDSFPVHPPRILENLRDVLFRFGNHLSRDRLFREGPPVLAL